MLKGLRFGSNNVARSRAFSDAAFEALGVAPSTTPTQYPLILSTPPGETRFLWGTASHGEAESKPQACDAFGATLRDPDGNMISAYAGLGMD